MNLLIRKARNHDRAAFQQLMEQEGKSMYKIAKAILKNDEDVADAMQETALACWEKIDTLKKDKYFRTWLTRILINNCNEIYRQRARIVSGENIPEMWFQEVEEDNQMSSFIGQPVTQGNVTVTAQQSIVDNHFAHLSFKVEGYQVKDGEQPGFSDITITVGDNEDYTGGWSASFYNGLISGPDGRAVHPDGTPLKEDEEISYILEDGSMEFQVDMMSDVKGAFFDQPIHVELKNLGIYGGKAEDVIVEEEGDWSFDWTLQGNDEVKKYELNAPLGDSGATVIQAELSPISVFVSYDFPKQKETETGTDENGEEFIHTTFKDAPVFTGVRLKDGTVYTGISGAGINGYTAEDSDIYESLTALERVIDVDQVESLLFVKSYPDSRQPLTEENLYFVSVE